MELPRPWLLLRTTAWSLTESAGLPIAALAVGAWLGGRDVGLLAGLGATWLIAVIRKIATGSIPSLLIILAIEFTVQTVIVIATGQLWIFLLHFPLANFCLFILFARSTRGPNPLLAKLAAEVVGLRQPTTHYHALLNFFQLGTWLWAGIFLLLAGIMSALLVTEPTAGFLLGSLVATVALILAGAGGSVLWLRQVLHKCGVSVRFVLVSGWPGWLPRRAQDVLLDRLREAFVLVGRRYPARRALHLATGVAHRDGQPGMGEHEDVVRHVPDGGDLLRRDLVGLR